MPIPREKRNYAAPAFVIVVLVSIWGWVGNDILLQYESQKASLSRGSPVKGYLINGKRLPTSGPNFQTYSRFMSSFGRTCVNGKVRQTMLDAYRALYDKHPELQFVYGETGWCSGGSFWPHHTHQNGLSVDFMVPVRRNKRIAELPTTILDGFGYRDEFDKNGKMGEYQIDFEAMALHLEALRKAARKNDVEIERVIFAPELQKLLFKTHDGRRLRHRLKWVVKPVWTRHDEHYHVDFAIKHATRSRKKAAGHSSKSKGSWPHVR